MKLTHFISSNIVSNLGFSTQEVMNNILNGNSGLALHNDFQNCEPYFASKLEINKIDSEFEINPKLYTKFEKMAILSIQNSNSQNIDFKDDKIIFVLATTKGNIDLLEQENYNYDDLMLWKSAQKIADYFGNQNVPLLISNACISGVSALIFAQRLLIQEKYKTAVVVGCDLVSRFVVAGFQSFKALSQNRCRPFDKNRNGLNLGEAAATAILQLADLENLEANEIYLDKGFITNDATHISAPSRTAEGLIRAINQCDTTEIGFIAAHGTATPYNDAMEALAIEKMGFAHLPTFSLKGYFGHTLGAAGLLETIVASELLKQKRVIKNIDFEEIDNDFKINISHKTEPFEAKAFLKTISGFGGCNAALVVRKK